MMPLVKCWCCLKRGFGASGKEETIVTVWAQLFSSKIKTQNQKAVHICLKCYLRLKLSYVYRKPFANLYKHYEDCIPLSDYDLMPSVESVRIISQCPICLISQPSIKHIYEHLMHSGTHKGCGINVDNSTERHSASPKCEQREENPYFCSGMCGASFKCAQLLEIHQNACRDVESEMKAECGDTFDCSTTSVSNSPITVESHISSMSTPCDRSVDMEIIPANVSQVENGAISQAKCITRRHHSAPAHNKSRTTSTVRKPSTKQRKRLKQCCSICGKWVNSLKKHIITHSATHNPSDLECRYCHKHFLTLHRLKHHETVFCPLRQNIAATDINRCTSEQDSDAIESLKPFNSANTNESDPFEKRNLYKQCCPICGKWVNILKKHMITHSTVRNPSDLVCRYCHKHFIRLRRLKKHETVICPLRQNMVATDTNRCTNEQDSDALESLEPSSNAAANTNESDPLEKKNLYKQCCPVCGEWRHKLKQHLLTHSSSLQFDCKYCHKLFKSRPGAQSHQIICRLRPQHATSDEKEKQFVCEVCGKAFHQKRLLTSHKKLHITFPCPICKLMINKSSEINHFQQVHDSVSVVCHNCGKLCKNLSTLKGHIFRYHRPNAPRYACDKCTKTFKNNTQLTIHRATHEVGTREIPCETCGLKFFTATALYTHVRAVHKRTSSRTCTVCGLTLCSAGTLKVHERQHTGVKPYACDLCDKTFAQKPPLNRHKRSQHNIIPTLTEKCVQCDKMFASKGTLKTHLIKMH